MTVFNAYKEATKKIGRSTMAIREIGRLEKSDARVLSGPYVLDTLQKACISYTLHVESLSLFLS